jgi:hypothetical protein
VHPHGSPYHSSDEKIPDETGYFRESRADGNSVDHFEVFAFLGFREFVPPADFRNSFRRERVRMENRRNEVVSERSHESHVEIDYPLGKNIVGVEIPLGKYPGERGKPILGLREGGPGDFLEFRHFREERFGLDARDEIERAEPFAERGCLRIRIAVRDLREVSKILGRDRGTILIIPTKRPSYDFVSQRCFQVVILPVQPAFAEDFRYGETHFGNGFMKEQFPADPRFGTDTGIEIGIPVYGNRAVQAGFHMGEDLIVDADFAWGHGHGFFG